MAALTARRLTKQSPGERFTDPVKAGVVIHEGALCVLDAGFLAPARTALGLRPRGVAEMRTDNATGANGAMMATTHAGFYWLDNDASVNRTHIGGTAYMVDDQTVAATDGGGTRSAAGLIVDVDANGVLVKIKP
jgi:hypothetical protein